MFTIKLQYSSQNENCFTYIDYIWTDLEIVKKNIKRLHQHYLASRKYKSFYGSYSKQKESDDYLESLKNEEWYIKENHNFFFIIKLIDDNGKDFEYYTAEWMGYFERLKTLEVVLDPKDKELSIDI